jgi:hypothetical protein
MSRERHDDPDHHQGANLDDGWNDWNTNFLNAL